MKRFNTYVLICIGLLFIAAGDGNGTPSPGKWRQQTLIGANETHIFYYETIRNYPRSYYSYSEEVSICRKRRADYAVEETILLRTIQYRADPNTLVWTMHDEDTTISFDLPRYLRANQVCPAIHEQDPTFPSFDGDGIYFGEGPKKVVIVSMVSIQSQAPLMNEAPRVVGSWVTAETWRETLTGKDQKKTIFYLVQSGSSDQEGQFAEDIVFVVR